MVRAFAVPGDGRSRFFQIRLQLFDVAGFREQFITPAGENPMDVLVLPVARGGDQFLQLVRIRDVSCRHLADSRQELPPVPTCRSRPCRRRRWPATSSPSSSLARMDGSAGGGESIPVSPSPAAGGPATGGDLPNGREKSDIVGAWFGSTRPVIAHVTCAVPACGCRCTDRWTSCGRIYRCRSCSPAR